MGDEWRARIAAFGSELGFGDEHQDLLLRAFTHRSVGDDAPLGDNERLEFLGDTVLALVVCEHLYRENPEFTEGQLTKLKQRYVSEPSLATAAVALGLGPLLAIAPGDDVAGGRDRPSTLSDVFEAVLGAIYLALGLEAARAFVKEHLIDQVDPNVVWDYKSRLQELFQEKHTTTPYYRSAPSSGPAHAPIFRSEALALIGSGGAEQVLGEGSGTSKKLAEQDAARNALQRLEAKPKRSRKKAVAPTV